MRDKPPSPRNDLYPRHRLRAAIAVMAALALWWPAPSQAQSRPFGAGVILGAPSGLSAKYWLRHDRAVDLAASWSFDGDDRVQLMADYVWHRSDLEGLQDNRSYAYYGVGGRIRTSPTSTALGVRVPLGVTYLFEEAPFDVFIEVAPFFDLVPSTRLGLHAGVGGRYYFTPRRSGS